MTWECSSWPWYVTFAPISSSLSLICSSSSLFASGSSLGSSSGGHRLLNSLWTAAQSILSMVGSTIFRSLCHHRYAFLSSASRDSKTLSLCLSNCWQPCSCSGSASRWLDLCHFYCSHCRKFSLWYLPSAHHVHCHCGWTGSRMCLLLFLSWVLSHYEVVLGLVVVFSAFQAMSPV